MKLNSNTTPKFDKQRIEQLSLQVAEIQSVITFLSESDNLPSKEALTLSALERLTTWLQADIQALMQAYAEQAKTAQFEAVYGGDAQ